MFRRVSRRALMATAGAFLIGVSGFLLGQRLGDSGSSTNEPLPRTIVTHESRIPIPNLGGGVGFPELSKAAGPRTSRPTP